MKILGGLVCTLLLLSACTGGDDKKPSPDRAEQRLERDATAAEPAWTVDLPVLGQPRVVGTTAVAIVKARTNQLDLVGVDTATGAVAWTHPYSPGAGPNGYAMTPVVVQDDAGVESVALLEPPKPLSLDNPAYWLTPVVVLDPATGTERFRTRPVYAATPLDECQNEVDACIRASYGKGTDVQNLRVDLAARSIDTDTAGIAGDRRELASAGLFSNDDRPGELIGVERDGKTLWSTPVTDLLGEFHSSDNGWSLNWDEKADIYTGYIGDGMPEDVRQQAEQQKAYTYDFAYASQVSFDGKTGKVIWSADGILKTCFGLRRQDGDVTYGAQNNPVRCSVTGSRSFDKGEPTAIDLTMTVEGYDPATGKTVWSAPIDDAAAEAFVTGEGRRVSTGSQTALLPTSKGARLFDTKTGDSVAADAKDLFACFGDAVETDYVIPLNAGSDRESAKRFGEALVEQCTPDGAVTDQPMTVANVKDAGQRVDDTTYVLSSTGGLVGFEIPKG